MVRSAASFGAPTATFIGGALLGLLLSILGATVMTATMMGVGIADVGAGDVGAMLTAMAAGTALLLRAFALALVLVTAVLLPRWPATMRIASVVGAGIALAALTWTGHGGMDAGRRGLVHAGSDMSIFSPQEPGSAGCWCWQFCCSRRGRRRTIWRRLTSR